MTDPAPAPQSASSAALRLLPMVLPGVVVGVASALVLIAVTVVANGLEDVLWSRIPDALGVDPAAPLWIVGILTLDRPRGRPRGDVRAGSRRALTRPPSSSGDRRSRSASCRGWPWPRSSRLAGGVSLGPENPLVGINVGLAVAIGLRVLPRVPGPAWGALAFAGTIGAMFGTPIGAALLLSESMNESGQRLWDRLFGPLVAAAAGALTMDLLGGDSFVLTIVPYVQPQLIDLVTGSLIAAGSAAAGMVAVYAFKASYPLFQRLRSPMVILIVGGFLLGLLGVIGGPISLFKGLDQMKELTATVGDYTPAGLALLAGIKLLAVVIAGTSGFRGGRIFPSVFAGVAIGLFVNALLPQIPEAIAVSASLVGILVAVTRSGWLAIFMGALLVNDPTITPILAIVVLPAWLVVTGRPEMVIKPRTAPAETA